jgi:hypothetical protein
MTVLIWSRLEGPNKTVTEFSLTYRHSLVMAWIFLQSEDRSTVTSIDAGNSESLSLSSLP